MGGRMLHACVATQMAHIQQIFSMQQIIEENRLC